MDKIPIKEALKQLNISRTSLYNYIKKLAIIPIKKANRVYLSKEQITVISLYVSNKQDVCTDQNEQREQFEQPKKQQDSAILQIKFLENNLEKQNKKIEHIEGINQKLLIQLGQWQGRAKTLEEQNHKLLRLQIPKSEKIGFFQKIFGKKVK